MTTEELFGYVTLDGLSGIYIAQVLSDFFELNMVVPKGVNRHPDADVLHEFFENPKLTLQYAEYEDSDNGGNNLVWYDGATFDRYFTSESYRIKPPEPVYEWQWCLMDKRKCEVTSYMASNNHLTDEEAKDLIQKYINEEHFKPIKVEETKRVRQ